VPIHIVDAAPLAADAPFVDATHRLFADLVAGGAALGWIDPPAREEIAALLASLTDPHEACAVAALDGDEPIGFGYWRRYARPTHRPHANLERMAVASAAIRSIDSGPAPRGVAPTPRLSNVSTR